MAGAASWKSSTVHLAAGVEVLNTRRGAFEFPAMKSLTGRAPAPALRNPAVVLRSSTACQAV
jgi:hypothetical protein